MKFSYFPGCTLKTKAKDLDAFARASARVLGFELQELPDWQCCGAVYPMAKDEIATKLSSVRALVSARDRGEELSRFARPATMSSNRSITICKATRISLFA